VNVLHQSHPQLMDTFYNYVSDSEIDSE